MGYALRSVFLVCQAIGQRVILLPPAPKKTLLSSKRSGSAFCDEKIVSCRYIVRTIPQPPTASPPPLHKEAFLCICFVDFPDNYCILQNCPIRCNPIGQFLFVFILFWWCLPQPSPQICGRTTSAKTSSAYCQSQPPQLVCPFAIFYTRISPLSLQGWV